MRFRLNEDQVFFASNRGTTGFLGARMHKMIVIVVKEYCRKARTIFISGNRNHLLVVGNHKRIKSPGEDFEYLGNKTSSGSMNLCL